MGGSSSHHHHQHQHQHRAPKAASSSLFSCGGGISSPFICGTSFQVEDDPAILLVNSAENCTLDKFQNPIKDSAPSSSAGSGSTNPESRTRVSDSKNVTSSGISQFKVGCSDATASDKTGHLFESNELFCPHQVVSDRQIDQTSTLSINIEANCLNTICEDMCPSLNHYGTSSFYELGETSSEESLNGIQGTAVMDFSNFSSRSTSTLSDSQFSNCTPRGGSDLIVPERGLVRRDDSTFLGDVAGFASSEVSAASSLIDNERRNTRLLCDPLSRRSRGYHESRNYLVSNDDCDNLGYHNRWFRDLTSDFLGEGVGGSLRSYEIGTQRNINHQWHSTSEILGITHDALDDNAPRTRTCLTGIHPRAPCSCESILREQNSGSRASISRIVILAEALFEVLDGIYRQPLSGPLHVDSVPAEESVVNSLPMKNYKKPEESVCSDDADKCYICLSEYENGDHIRILPCQHEYHVSCIDKWLTEIHSVCPLCRADVQDGFTISSIST